MGPVYGYRYQRHRSIHRFHKRFSVLILPHFFIAPKSCDFASPSFYLLRLSSMSGFLSKFRWHRFDVRATFTFPRFDIPRPHLS